MYYLAYGSNLNLSEMSRRCPSAKLIGVGEIDNYELEFRFYLSVNECLNSKVLVGVFDIQNDSDWAYLDFYEGFPSLYTKKEIPCKIENNEIVGTIYIMGDGKATYPHNYPSDLSYLERCIKGYDDCNIDTLQLTNALDKALKKRG